jgi:hypothetical protein
MFKTAFEQYKASRTEKKHKIAAAETTPLNQSVPTLTQSLLAAMNPESEILTLQKQIEEKSQAVRDKWYNYQRQLEE